MSVKLLIIVPKTTTNSTRWVSACYKGFLHISQLDLLMTKIIIIKLKLNKVIFASHVTITILYMYE